MPYIIQSTRLNLDENPPDSSAELSFAICDKINDFLQTAPNGGFEGAISKVFGALSAARLAFEQDVAIPYERIKKEENGPVFNTWPPNGKTK